MDRDRRAALLEQYRTGYQAVVDALAGATYAELDAVPGPGAWPARAVVHHLADSEMTSAIRLRRLLAEDEPVISGYDEAEFARRLFYDRPLDASLAAFLGARLSSAAILERLDETAWSRSGTHTESGRYTVETWLEIYAAHAHDHAEQIARARAAGRA